MVRGVRQYAVARALRMLPGLWVMLILSALVSVLLFSPFPLSDTTGTADFWKYIGYNGLTIGRQYVIPGTFVDNQLGGVINGSLWTIPREVQCYVALAIIGALGLLSRRWWLLAAVCRRGGAAHLAAA